MYIDRFDKTFSTLKVKKYTLLSTDVLVVIVSFLISMMITSNIIIKWEMFLLILINLIFSIMNLNLFRKYMSLWDCNGEYEVIFVTLSCIVNSLFVAIVNKFMGDNLGLLFYILNSLITIEGIMNARVISKEVKRFKMQKNITRNETFSRILVIGAGSAGSIIIDELYENPQLRKLPVAIIDDDSKKLKKRICNVPIVGSCKDIKKVVSKYKIDEIIFSIANIPQYRKEEIINICTETKCKLKTIPGIFEIIDGKVDIKKIKDIDIENLLGRESVKTNLENISNYINDNVVLVTGAGGSIGSELCRQILKYNPKKLVILDIYENGLYEIQQELTRKYKDKLNLEVIVCSIRDKKRLDNIFNKYRPDVVFHAAAHKHVPLMESSPCEAIKNNIFGTENLAEISNKYKVKKFVLISTDKAVNPTNIMGATKRVAEMIIQTVNGKSYTEFVAVRFGNVLGSNGSVIPLFKKQIEEGGPVTVTHPEVTRFFMTINEAVSLVIQAGSIAKGGEIFVLNMGDSVKIIDLAKSVIRLSGFDPEIDIKIEFSGLRPGEKLYEELLMEEEGLKKTEYNKIFIGRPVDINIDNLNQGLQLLKKVVDEEELELIEPIIKTLVPTYKNRKFENVG